MAILVTLTDGEQIRAYRLTDGAPGMFDIHGFNGSTRVIAAEHLRSVIDVPTLDEESRQLDRKPKFFPG